MNKINENTLIPIGITVLCISATIGIVSFMNTTYITGQATAKMTEQNTSSISKIQEDIYKFNSILLEKVTRIEERQEFFIKQQRGQK